MKNKQAYNLLKNTFASINFMKEKIFYSAQEVESEIKERNNKGDKSRSTIKVLSFAKRCPFTGDLRKYFVIR